MVSMTANLGLANTFAKGPHNGCFNPDDHLSLLPAHVRRRDGYEAWLDQVRQLRQDHEYLTPRRRALSSARRCALLEIVPQGLRS